MERLQRAGADQANTGYRLSCFTTIQNFNRTFFYAACQPGTGDWMLIQVPDSTSLSTVLTNYQNQYYLADFSTAFENAQLNYYTYFRAGAKSQSMQGPYTYSALNSQWHLLISAASPSQMTRLQAYPTSTGAMFVALFETGGGTSALYLEPVFLGTAQNLSNSESFESRVQSITTNTLSGLCYEPVDGYLAGCWGQLQSGAQYFQDLTWNGLGAMVQSGLVPLALAAYPDTPDWQDYFATNLGPQVMGYAYAVGKNGQTILTGSGGLARGPNETSNPNQAFTPDTRINLASVSKAITGMALEIFVEQTGRSLSTPFLTPALEAKLTELPVTAASQVTLAQLASMTTGLFIYPPDAINSTEGPADIDDSVGTPPQLFGPYKTIWADISDYLAQTPPSNPPSYNYNNTNYAILQVYIELALSGNPSDPQDYVNYVTNNVLTPAGADGAITATPDGQDNATLFYSGHNDGGQGYFHPTFTMVGASGWIGSVQGLIALMNALRGSTLLPASTVTSMFSNGISPKGGEIPTFPQLRRRFPLSKPKHNTGGLSPPARGGAPRPPSVVPFCSAGVGNFQSALDIFSIEGWSKPLAARVLRPDDKRVP